MDTDLLLMQDLCARVCHDLGGPVGTVTGALDLTDSMGAEALDLARDASASMRARLRVWRAACGGGSGDLTVTAIGEMLEGVLAGGRAQLAVQGIPGDLVVPSRMAQVLLTASLLAGEALPRGGVVHLLRDEPAGGFILLPEGRSARWPPALTAALAGEAREGGPRDVLGPFLLFLARGTGLRVELLMSGGPDLPALSITTPRA